MTIVCWQCGDIGLIEALVYCAKCKVALRHSYCLEELPKDLSQEIDWICEYCSSNCTNSVSNATLPISQKTKRLRSRRTKAKNPCHGKSSVNDVFAISNGKSLTAAFRIDENSNVETCPLGSFRNETSSCDNLHSGAVTAHCLKEDKIDNECKEVPKRRRLILACMDELECTNSPSNSKFPEAPIQGSRIVERETDESSQETSSIRGLLVDPIDQHSTAAADFASRDLQTGTKSTKKKPKDHCHNKSSINVGLVIPQHQHQCAAVKMDASFNSADHASNELQKSTSSAVMSSSCLEEHKTEKQQKRMPKNRTLLLADEDQSECLNSSSIESIPMKIPNHHSTSTNRKTNYPCQDPIIGNQPDQQPVKGYSPAKFPCQPACPAVPVFPHIWSGCFNISNTEFGPFKAHLSSRACRKVCNLSRMLPSVLQMEKFPRLDAWPNSFKNSPPTNDNIALFFLSGPESSRVEAALDSLVDDIINDDLMLRCKFDDVELLIFSSFVLPEEHQRLSGKYYVWGVFKPRKLDVHRVPTTSYDNLTEGNQMCEALMPGAETEVKYGGNGRSKGSTCDVNLVTSPASQNLQCNTTVHVTGDLQETISAVFHGNDMTKKHASTLKHFAGMTQGVVDSMRSRLHDFVDDFWCISGHQLVARGLDIERQATNYKLCVADLNFTREGEKILGRGIVSGEVCQGETHSDAVNIDVQHSQLVKPAQDQRREWAQVSEEKNVGQFCGDYCTDAWQCNQHCSLNLFPVLVEDLAIAVKVRTGKSDIDLQLGLGQPSFGYECDAKSLKKNLFLDSSILH
ncbi:hypothetical protein HPP92_027096 [Vanilla planifolia]|uniref:Zinc finger PHD-type domain-containing protein n=2 Tax=Vanilla planifolia TaxID=51239 RepID=A0A835PD35_VANPL|nr:hypothetical protein HPP92_027096 [Vanilla planifolia]